MKALLCVKLADDSAMEVYPNSSVTEPLMRKLKVGVKLPKILTGSFAPFDASIAEFTFERVAEVQHASASCTIDGKEIYEVGPVALYWLSSSPPTGWCWIVHPEHKKFVLSRSMK